MIPPGRSQSPATDFTQTELRQGEPASERTEVRFLYDEDFLYVGAHLFDSGGPSALLVNDVTRDFESGDSDYFNVLLDTFNDDRNGFMFGTNPQGVQARRPDGRRRGLSQL